jgi:hypothetical protein
MRYSIEEAQLLYDSLPLITTPKVFNQPKFTKLYPRLLFYYDGYSISVTNARSVYEIINIDVTLKVCNRDINNLLQYRSNVRKICHEVPLEEVPLYINDEPIKYIAAWRLRIAR